MRWILPALWALRSVTALWPAPSKLETGDQYVKLHDSFSIATQGNLKVPGDLRAAMADAEKLIKNDKMKALEVDLAGIEQAVESSEHVLQTLNLALTTAGGNTKRQFKTNIRHIHYKRDLSSIASEINKPYEQRDESYTLEIAADSPLATITASTALGLLRGLQTFTQLVYTTSGEEPTRYIRHAPISIQDKPAYPIRGLLLDTARNFHPMKDIKRTLNVMSYAKMN